MEKYRVSVCGIKEFEQLMKSNRLDDSNVEKMEQTAFISIVSPQRQNEGYMFRLHGSGDEHYFKENHPNVLNVDLNDVETDEGDYKAITSEQSTEIMAFILRNERKDFIIHCHAGISRSGGIALFMFDHFDWVDRGKFNLEVQPRIVPNMRIYRELTKQYSQK
jgi:predicted protein tyrosine phosphatase